MWRSPTVVVHDSIRERKQSVVGREEGPSQASRTTIRTIAVKKESRSSGPRRLDVEEERGREGRIKGNSGSGCEATIGIKGSVRSVEKIWMRFVR